MSNVKPVAEDSGTTSADPWGTLSMNPSCDQ